MLPGAVLVAIEARLTCHFPAESAVVDRFCPLNETDTVAPTAAVPHTGTDILRWRTALLVNGLASTRTAALTVCAGRLSPPFTSRARLTSPDKINVMGLSKFFIDLFS